MIQTILLTGNYDGIACSDNLQSAKNKDEQNG